MTEYTLDMTMMLATHDALRRDLAQVTDLETRTQGWSIFDRMLRMHHQIEDDLLWPVMRDEVKSSDDLALLDQMEAEHTAIGPLLEALDGALARSDAASRAHSDLATHLVDHLAHEERDALQLVDRTLTEEQWMKIGQAMAQQVGPDMSTYLPWLLEDADDDTTTRVLGVIPPPVQETYAEQWRPAFDALDRWATGASVR
jgi:hypothetical protein